MKKVRKVPEKLREKYTNIVKIEDPVSLMDEETDRSYVCNDIESAFLDNPLGSAKDLEKFKKQINLYRAARRVRRMVKLLVAGVFIAAIVWLIIGIKLNNKEMKPILKDIRENVIINTIIDNK